MRRFQFSLRALLGAMAFVAVACSTLLYASETIASVDQRKGRVAPGGCPPGAPTDPDVQISRIRFLKSGVCYAHGRRSERRQPEGAGTAAEVGQTNSTEAGSSVAAAEAKCPRRASPHRGIPPTRGCSP